MAKVCQTHIQCPNVKSCYHTQSCDRLLQVHWLTSTESPSSWDWNGSREIVQLYPPAQAGSPGASYPGLWPRQFVNMSKESPQHIWATWCRVQSPFTVKRISWCSERASCVLVCAYCLWACHWATLKRVWLSLFCTLPSGIYTHYEISLSFSSPDWAAPMYSACAPGERWSGPLIILVVLHWASPYVHVSHVLGIPELDTGLQMVPHRCWLEGQDHVPQPAGSAFPDAAQTLLAAFATRAHCCLIFSLSTRPSPSFSAQLLSGWIAPACTCAWGCSSQGAGL